MSGDERVEFHAGLLDGEVIGYQAGGVIYSPDDVLIIRRGPQASHKALAAKLAGLRDYAEALTLPGHPEVRRDLLAIIDRDVP